MFVFQIGLKPMPKDASRRELSKSSSRIEKGALCAELRPFYCSIRILAPMLNITFLYLFRPSVRRRPSSVRRLDHRPSVVVVRPSGCKTRFL